MKSVILLDNNDSIKSISYIPYESRFNDPKTISSNAKSNIIYGINSTDHPVQVNVSGIQNYKYIPLYTNISSAASIAVDPELDILYVADEVTNSIFKIDTNTEKIIKKIPLKDTPVSIAVDPKTHKVYVVNFNLGYNYFNDISNYYLSVIDGNTNNETGSKIPLSSFQNIGKVVSSISIDPEVNKIYISISVPKKSDTDTDIYDSMLYNIDVNTTEIKGQIKVGDNPVSIAVDPKTHKVYVVDKEKTYVSVIDGNTNNETGSKIPLSNIKQPVSIAVDPELDILYVIEDAYNSLSIINGNTTEIKRQIKVGDKPVSIAVDPKTHKVYVLNKGNPESVEKTTSISIIDLIKDRNQR